MALRRGDPENMTSSKSGLIPEEPKENYYLTLYKGTSNMVAHVLIGFVVAANMFFAVRFGLPLNENQIHIVLCVLGFQFLMAESILALSPDNGWTASLTLAHKRRVHWVLQIMGSAMAIAGCIIRSLIKTVHWDTLHGQFALVSMVFTVVSMVNGLTSLYAYELRRIIPGKLSKVTHILFGTVAFVAASISLCYGMDKGSFINWGSQSITITLIVFTSVFTFIIVINPMITMYSKYLKRN